MTGATHGEVGLLPGLIDDGRPLLALTAVMLLLSGAFAIFLSVRREFLPHDVAFLGMTAERLCAIADCRIVRFMFHDRVAFGGTLISVATLYLWLAAFPLRQGYAWAWWALVASGVLGFGSFLSYLGYGYFDSWHGAASLALLPVFVAGLVLSRSGAHASVTPWLRSTDAREMPAAARFGRCGLLATGAGLTLAGLVILVIGTTDVFVAEDLGFMGQSRAALDAINPRLVPLIAHDRAGFGGGLATTGVLLSLCAWYAPPSRAFHQAVALAGAAGFGCAIGVHFAEGYTNPLHLAPAFAGAALFAVSFVCEWTGLRRHTGVQHEGVERRSPQDRAATSTPEVSSADITQAARADDVEVLLQRVSDEIAQGRSWRAKELLGGWMASSQGPLAPVVLERYGALLDSLGDRFEAGKFLFISGSRQPAHADAIALFLHRTRNTPAPALVALLPRAVRRAGLGHLPATVRDALAERGVQSRVLHGTSPVEGTAPQDTWQSRLGLIAVVAFLVASVIAWIVGIVVIGRAIWEAVR